ALANGLLTDREHDPGVLERRAPLDERAAGLGVSIDAVAIAVALAQPWTDVVLSGAATREQLTSNLGATHVAVDGSDLANAALERQAWWRRRARLAWN